MKSNSIRSLFVSIYLLSTLFLPGYLNADQQGPPVSDPGVTISLDFQDARLKDILKALSIQSNLNFIASEAIKDRPVTLYLDKVPLKEAMDKLFKANNLYYELDKGANVFIVKDLGRPEVETIIRIFYLKYAAVSNSNLTREISSQIASDTSGAGTATSATAKGGKGGGSAGGGIAEAVKGLLTEYGSVMEDPRTNSLIVKDLPNRMPAIAQVIAYLDVPQPQIMLEVEMLDVSKNLIDKLGVKWGSTDASSILTMILKGAKTSTGFPLGDLIGDKTVSKTFTPGSIDFSTSYTVLLDLLRSQTDTRYLARPRILTLNNQTAEIKITANEAVGETKSVSGDTGNQTTTTEAERYETGVSLRVTPQISLESNEITMIIIPSVAEASASGITSSTGVKFYNPEVRSTKSIIRLKDGETVVVGGLIRNEKTVTYTKLPILGDIPLLGALFRHKDQTKNKERELLVFITPRIIRDTESLKLIPAKKSDIPLREQNIFSVADRSKAITVSLNNLEKK